MSVVIAATGLKKTFNRRVVFKDVSFSLRSGETLLVTGRNGSGKSTLLKIVASVLTPTEGSVVVEHPAARRMNASSLLYGFVSPYLNLYDEFTARENLSLSLSIRGLRPEVFPIDGVLNQVGLEAFRNTPSRVFSSGMKQRLKYAFAVIHNPPILILDEPMSNLDGAGKEIVRALMKNQAQKGVLIVATNEPGEVEHFHSSVSLDG